MKKLITLLSIPLIAGTLNSCRDASNDFAKVKEKDGLVMKAWVDGMGNTIRIEKPSYLNDYNIATHLNAYLIARDNQPSYKENGKLIIGDGRFDEIRLENVAPGDLLEKYANVDSINKLYQDVQKTGEDIN